MNKLITRDTKLDFIIIVTGSFFWSAIGSKIEWLYRQINEIKQTAVFRSFAKLPVVNKKGRFRAQLLER